MPTEDKPCPFCDSRAYIEGGRGYHWMACYGCGARGPTAEDPETARRERNKPERKARPVEHNPEARAPGGGYR